MTKTTKTHKPKYNTNIVTNTFKEKGIFSGALQAAKLPEYWLDSSIGWVVDSLYDNKMQDYVSSPNIKATLSFGTKLGISAVLSYKIPAILTFQLLSWSHIVGRIFDKEATTSDLFYNIASITLTTTLPYEDKNKNKWKRLITKITNTGLLFKHSNNAVGHYGATSGAMFADTLVTSILPFVFIASIMVPVDSKKTLLLSATAIAATTFGGYFVENLISDTAHKLNSDYIKLVLNGVLLVAQATSVYFTTGFVPSIITLAAAAFFYGITSYPEKSQELLNQLDSWTQPYVQPRINQLDSWAQTRWNKISNAADIILQIVESSKTIGEVASVPENVIDSTINFTIDHVPGGYLGEKTAQYLKFMIEAVLIQKYKHLAPIFATSELLNLFSNNKNTENNNIAYSITKLGSMNDLSKNQIINWLSGTIFSLPHTEFTGQSIYYDICFNTGHALITTTIAYVLGQLVSYGSQYLPFEGKEEIAAIVGKGLSASVFLTSLVRVGLITYTTAAAIFIALASLNIKSINNLFDGLIASILPAQAKGYKKHISNFVKGLFGAYTAAKLPTQFSIPINLVLAWNILGNQDITSPEIMSYGAWLGSLISIHFSFTKEIRILATKSVSNTIYNRWGFVPVLILTTLGAFVGAITAVGFPYLDQFNNYIDRTLHNELPAYAEHIIDAKELLVVTVIAGILLPTPYNIFVTTIGEAVLFYMYNKYNKYYGDMPSIAGKDLNAPVDAVPEINIKQSNELNSDAVKNSLLATLIKLAVKHEDANILTQHQDDLVANVYDYCENTTSNTDTLNACLTGDLELSEDHSSIIMVY